MGVAGAEILFVKCVKDGIPNRDPLSGGDARRLFAEEDGRISLSDVSIKRDVRDYILAKYPDGGPEGRYHIWCRQARAQDGRLLGGESLAQAILLQAGLAGEKDKAAALAAAAFDVRVFGAVFTLEGRSFHRTGPVQFGWAHSLHPARTRYVQGNAVMPERDVRTEKQEENEGQRGVGWGAYHLPFAVFAMPGVINFRLAEQTGMDEKDVDMLLEALWKGTISRQSRARGLQKPLLLVHVVYKDPFFRIGFLEDYLSLEPGREEWLGPSPPSSLADIVLDVRQLTEVLAREGGASGKVAGIRWWKDPELVLRGELPGEMGRPW